MNEQYWQEFYQDFKCERPTSFAKFCMRYIDKDKPLLDIGCGTGRDTKYFASKGINVTGVDAATMPMKEGSEKYIKKDFKFLNFNNHQVYARFFIHSIENLEIAQLIGKCEDLLMLEFRNKGDEPKIYKNHTRNLIDGQSLFITLCENGFSPILFNLDRGLAEFRGEDPLVCRIIVKRK